MPSRHVPRCRCSSPPPPASASLFKQQCCECARVCSSCLVSRQMVRIFFFLSMPTHVLQSRLRHHLVAGRTKRRDASLSEVIGEQPPFAWDFVAISACVSRSLALCQEMTDTHVVSRVCVYLTKRQRESMMGHCGKAYKALLECCLVKVASVPLKCAHSGYVFFLLHTTAVNELVLSCFPSPSPPTCLFICSFYQFDCV